MTKRVNTRNSYTTADYLTVMSGRGGLHGLSVEAHLRLCVDISTTFAQDLHHVSLASQRGYVERCVSFLESNTNHNKIIRQISACLCKNKLRVLLTECCCVLYSYV